jgi:hypothetical protein
VLVESARELIAISTTLRGNNASTYLRASTEGEETASAVSQQLWFNGGFGREMVEGERVVASVDARSNIADGGGDAWQGQKQL